MEPKRIRMLIVWTVAALAISAAAAGADTWHVYDIDDLNYAEGHHGSGDEIILHPNTYQLTQYLNLNKSNVTFRGATGDPDDVIIRGAGMNVQSGPLNGLMIENDNITVRDLTVKDIFWNGIQIRGEWDVDNTVLSNVQTINIGERHVKGSRGSSGDMDNVLIENCTMLQTQPLTSPHGNLDYVGGIDAMACNDWIVRDCLFQGIAGVSAGGRGAIFLWNGISNALVERNVFINCDRSIAFGNPSGPTNSITAPWHSVGGIIRNNTILRGDYIGLELCTTKDLKVYNNTVYSADAGYFRTLHILDDSGEGPTTNLDMQNNIIRGRILDNTVAGGWTAAAVAAMGNIVDTNGTVVLPSWFVDAAGGDFHLRELATPAINAAAVLADVPEDMDRGPRPYGDFPDMGADEFGSPMGDINYDGLVDGGDYTIWADHYGQSDVGFSGGDLNGDGVVNGGDYTLWADNYNLGGAGASAVPEPTSLALLATAAAATGLKRKVRRAS